MDAGIKNLDCGRQNANKFRFLVQRKKMSRVTLHPVLKGTNICLHCSR